MTVSYVKTKQKTFEETFKPVWTEVRKRGLTEKDVDALIQEAITKAHSWRERLCLGDSLKKRVNW